MKKVFDYAGNEIKEGQVISLIKIIDRQFFRAGFLIPATISGTGKNETILERKLPDKECFEIQESIEIIRGDLTMNELGYCIEGGTFVGYDTIGNLQNVWQPDTVIMAIKGISDTKEYYDLWKKKKNAKEATGLME